MYHTIFNISTFWVLNVHELDLIEKSAFLPACPDLFSILENGV